MSLNELLRDDNSNKWSNLNVQSVVAPTSTITTLNATTVNSVQTNANRVVIKDAVTPTNIIDMSKNLTVAQIISKEASTGALQPYEITASNVLWKNATVDPNEIVLSGTQLVTVGSAGTVNAGRYKSIFANINGATAVVQRQSGGLTSIIRNSAGNYTITVNSMSNILFATANVAQNSSFFCTVQPLSTSQLNVFIWNASAAPTPVDAVFIINISGDAI